MKTALFLDLATKSDEPHELEMLILHLGRSHTYQIAIYKIHFSVY